ncbi:MAG: NUDIX domain-containing protein [Spirochaetales bacterium]|nr:NUDIX domain-containing protein [Spirochaetales bacterium]
MNELLPIVDKSGKVIGKADRSACHSDKSLIHPVVHLHVMNSRSELLLQKRSMEKDLLPGYWDTGVGGHVSYGEEPFLSLQRETKEEIGISAENAKLLYTYINAAKIETEYVYSWLLRYDGPFTINKDELDEVKFWSRGGIEENLGKSVFTRNFEQEFKMLVMNNIFG